MWERALLPASIISSKLPSPGYSSIGSLVPCSCEAASRICRLLLADQVSSRYGFALLLAGCRTLLRPGAIWFIKDPQDQATHPIREILERSTFTQLRRIALSGIMYGCVVFLFVGSLGGLFSIANAALLPFRWRNR